MEEMIGTRLNRMKAASRLYREDFGAVDVRFHILIHRAHYNRSFAVG